MVICWHAFHDTRACSAVAADAGAIISVWVPRSHLVLLHLVTLDFTELLSCLSLSSWLGEKLNAPVSFALAAMEGFPMIPDWSCVLSMFLPTIPRISPCRSLSGRSKARQQEKDHFGFLRHSLKTWCKYAKYWTRKKMIDQRIKLSLFNCKNLIRCGITNHTSL